MRSIGAGHNLTIEDFRNHLKISDYGSLKPKLLIRRYDHESYRLVSHGFRIRRLNK